MIQSTILETAINDTSTIFFAISGDTINSERVSESTLTIERNANVVYNLRLFDDTNNKIIKIEVIFDSERSQSPDLTYNYIKSSDIRGNMLNLAVSNSNSIPTVFIHYYPYLIEENYVTTIRIYTMNGTIFNRIINIRFTKFSFADVAGDLFILNEQFIDNDYNHLFIIAETAKKDIIHFDLKQQANRGNARRPSDTYEDIEGEIVKITDHNVYICTIDNLYPLYLMDASIPTYNNNIVSLKDQKLIKTIKELKDILTIQHS